MKRKIYSIAFIGALLALCCSDCQADENLADGELHLIEATAYCDCEQLTACQTQVRPGIAAFGSEYYGSVAAVYTEDMDFIGYYEILDTGSERIANSEVLDIWLPTEEECDEFGRQKVYIKIIYGKG